MGLMGRLAALFGRSAKKHEDGPQTPDTLHGHVMDISPGHDYAPRPYHVVAIQQMDSKLLFCAVFDDEWNNSSDYKSIGHKGHIGMFKENDFVEISLRRPAPDTLQDSHASLMAINTMQVKIRAPYEGPNVTDLARHRVLVQYTKLLNN